MSQNVVSSKARSRFMDRENDPAHRACASMPWPGAGALAWAVTATVGHSRGADGEDGEILRHDRTGRLMRTSDGCLVFIHIPKTAGQTLHFVALRSYPQQETIHRNILDRPVGEEMEKIPLSERSSARLVWGRIPYGVHRHIPRRCEYITILREPTARVVSVYKHIRKTPGHELHDRLEGEQVRLELYVESGMDGGQTENSQTRQLSGRQFGAIDRDALDEAKRNLERFLLIGLTERFEESLVMLRRSLGLHTPPLYVYRNVSTPLDASEQAMSLIRDRNALDLELYAFARNLFEDRVARQGRSFKFEVSMLKSGRPLSRAVGGSADIIRKLPPTRAVRRSLRKWSSRTTD